MHESSYNGMAHALKDRLGDRFNYVLDVLDVGSRAIEDDFGGRTYRDLMPRAWHYTGCDLEPGKNVDLVSAGPYRIRDDADPYLYDLVISGQCIEHVEFPHLLVREMARMLKPGGLMILTAPWQWHHHPHPLDCWRVLPDGMRAMFRFAGLDVVDVYMHDTECWGIAHKPKTAHPPDEAHAHTPKTFVEPPRDAARLSVVIPTYNQDAMIVRHVQACADASRLPDEVVVVDDCGKPGLADKLRAETWPFTLVCARVLEDIPWNQPGARNLGMMIAQGDVLSFEDADHVPHPAYYDEALDAMARRPDVAVVRSTRVTIGDDPKKIAAGGGSFVARRRDVLAVGGWDEDFAGHYGHDDNLLYQRLRRLGSTHTLHGRLGVALADHVRGLDRDSSVNRKLYKAKLGRPRDRGAMLRFPWEIVGQKTQ